MRVGWITPVLAVMLLAGVGCGGNGSPASGGDAGAADRVNAENDGPADAGPESADAADRPSGPTDALVDNRQTDGDGSNDTPVTDAPISDAPATDASAAAAPAIDAPSSDATAIDARDAAKDSSTVTDARDAGTTTDAGTDAAADGRAGDAPPDGIGGCSEARLLDQATSMMNAWTRPTRMCEPSQTSTENETGFNDVLTVETCVGNECGSAGTCSVDIDWLTSFSVMRDQTGKLLADAKLHLDPRCTIRYSHGTDACVCVVDPTVLGVWLDWLSWVTPESSGSSGPLTFSIGGAIEISGAGRQYGPEVVTCQGTLVGSDGVDHCLPSSSTSATALREEAVTACDAAAKPWFNTLAATLQSYVPTYVGSCP